jgi:hypothetical protein
MLPLPLDEARNWSFTYCSSLYRVRGASLLVLGYLTFVTLRELYRWSQMMGAETKHWTPMEWIPFLVPTIGFVAMFVILFVAILVMTNCYLPYVNDKITVTPQTITWTNGQETIMGRWEEILHCHVYNHECRLILQGADERVIHFPTNWLTHKWWLLNSFYTLEEIVSRQVSLPKEEMWKRTQSGEILPPTLRSKYPTADTQVFSYYTQNNCINITFLTLCCSNLPVIFMSIYLIEHDIKFLYLFVITLFLTLSIAFKLFYWYRHSQVETDDLGIAFIGPEGVRWSISWLSIVKIDSSIGFVLYTRDGQKCRIPRGVARHKELQDTIARYTKTIY